MAYCKVCGDEEGLSKAIRFWSPGNDGWIFGRLCPWCYDDCSKRKPKPADYAYREHRKDYSSDDDSFIDAIYG